MYPRTEARRDNNFGRTGEIRVVVLVVSCLACLALSALPALAAPDAYSTQINPENCQLLRVDASSGVVTEIGSPETSCPLFLARSPADDLYSITGDTDLVLSRVDKTTGTVTTIGPLGVSKSGAQFVAMTFDPAGHLWATINTGTAPCAAAESTCLYSLDPATGAATLVGGSTTGPVGGLAADCTGVYAATYSEGSLFHVDTATGTLTAIGPTGVTPALQGMSFAADGTLWALGALVAQGPYHSYTIDPATGTGTQEATLTGYSVTPFDQGGFATALPSCPAPAPLVPVPTPVTVTPAFTG